MPPTYLRFSRHLQLFGDLFSGLPAYSNWREIQIELAQFSTVSLVIWIESSCWSTSFRFLSSLVMRYTRRKKKLEKMRTRRKYWVQPRLQGWRNHGQYHTLFAELRHPRVRHFPPPFRKSGIVGRTELLRHYFHHCQSLACLWSWTQLNFAGKLAVNAWDRLCVGDECSHVPQRFLR